MAFDIKKYIVTDMDSRVLPVFILLGVSGSISKGHDLQFHDAVQGMIQELATLPKIVPISVAIISFGSTVKVHTDLTPVSELQKSGIKELTVYGETRLVQALDLAKSIIEDKNRIPGRSYRPIVILVSDGHPNAGWESAMTRFTEEGRTQKCNRYSIAIGSDADKDVLVAFSGSMERVLYADTAAGIADNLHFINTVISGYFQPVELAGMFLTRDHSSISVIEDDDDDF